MLLVEISSNRRQYTVQRTTLTCSSTVANPTGLQYSGQPYSAAVQRYNTVPCYAGTNEQLYTVGLPASFAGELAPPSRRDQILRTLSPPSCAAAVQTYSTPQQQYSIVYKQTPE
jgi:hypothetical protein